MLQDGASSSRIFKFLSSSAEGHTTMDPIMFSSGPQSIFKCSESKENSHYVCLGDIAQTNMSSECFSWLLLRCIDYIAVVSEDSDWECVSES